MQWSFLVFSGSSPSLIWYPPFCHVSVIYFPISFGKMNEFGSILLFALQFSYQFFASHEAFCALVWISTAFLLFVFFTWNFNKLILGSTYGSSTFAAPWHIHRQGMVFIHWGLNCQFLSFSFIIFLQLYRWVCVYVHNSIPEHLYPAQVENDRSLRSSLVMLMTIYSARSSFVKYEI